MNRAQLAGEIEIGFVVGCRREQHHHAVVDLQILADRPVGLALTVAQVVRFVDDDQAVARELIREITDDPAVRQDAMRPELETVGVVIPHLGQVLRTQDQSLQHVVIPHHAGDG